MATLILIIALWEQRQADLQSLLTRQSSQLAILTY